MLGCTCQIIILCANIFLPEYKSCTAFLQEDKNVFSENSIFRKTKFAKWFSKNLKEDFFKMWSCIWQNIIFFENGFLRECHRYLQVGKNILAKFSL